jgi:hypothetical protein
MPDIDPVTGNAVALLLIAAALLLCGVLIHKIPAAADFATTITLDRP